MTETERAFLRAAAADPADDGLRLVYSDWLEEQPGEAMAAQAEFVRLQVARAKLVRESPGVPVAATKRERLLEQKYRRQWNGRVHRLLSDLGAPNCVDARRGAIRGWEYSRGMIGSVTLSAEALTALSGVLPHLGPVRRVVVYGWPPIQREYAMEYFVNPMGSKLLTFAFRGRTDVEAAAALFDRFSVVDLRAVAHDRYSYQGDWTNLSDMNRHLALFVDSPSVVLTHFRSPGDEQPTVHRLDPHDLWPQYRAEFAELTGFTENPPPYQG